MSNPLGVGHVRGADDSIGAFAPWVGHDTDNLQLVRGVIESLTSVSPGTTVIVGVDDAHLLDDLSTFVLHQIVQRCVAKLVLTVGDGEPIPVGIQELWKARDFERLDLQPLSHDETITLVSGALGGPLDPDTADRLWKLTSGNALYLRNIVEQEVIGWCVRMAGGAGSAIPSYQPAWSKRSKHASADRRHLSAR